MRIHGLLSWFNESPSWLVTTISSFARVCDRIVVIDGRYSLFQSDFDWSPHSETEAILAAAEGVGIPLTLHIPRSPFIGNEVEKKNLGMRLLLADAVPYEDWVFILDADEYVVSVSSNFREEVEKTREHAIAYGLEEYLDPFDNEEFGQSMGRLHRREVLHNSWRVKLRAMYRVLPEMEYVGTHHTVGGRGPDGQWVWLWGHPQNCPERDMHEELVVRHRNVMRTALRREQASRYYGDRDRLKIEVAP